jgi:hypothetical protein
MSQKITSATAFWITYFCCCFVNVLVDCRRRGALRMLPFHTPIFCSFVLWVCVLADFVIHLLTVSITIGICTVCGLTVERAFETRAGCGRGASDAVVYISVIITVVLL